MVKFNSAYATLVYPRPGYAGRPTVVESSSLADAVSGAKKASSEGSDAEVWSAGGMFGAYPGKKKAG